MWNIPIYYIHVWYIKQLCNTEIDETICILSQSLPANNALDALVPSGSPVVRLYRESIFPSRA